MRIDRSRRWRSPCTDRLEKFALNPHMHATQRSSTIRTAQTSHSGSQGRSTATTAYFPFPRDQRARCAGREWNGQVETRKICNCGPHRAPLLTEYPSYLYYEASRLVEEPANVVALEDEARGCGICHLFQSGGNATSSSQEPTAQGKCPEVGGVSRSMWIYAVS